MLPLYVPIVDVIQIPSLAFVVLWPGPFWSLRDVPDLPPEIGRCRIQRGRTGSLGAVVLRHHAQVDNGGSFLDGCQDVFLPFRNCAFDWGGEDLTGRGGNRGSRWVDHYIGEVIGGL